MSQISHSKYPQNFIDKLPHIHASFLKRFFSTFLDMMFVIIINVPIFLVLCRMTGGVTDTVNPPNIYNLNPKPITMLYFSVYMLFCSFVFFCVMPVYYQPQTLFSDLFNIRAVSLSGKKLTPGNFFKAYFVPMFLVIFANMVLFSMACSSDKSIIHITLTDKTKEFSKYWQVPVQILFSAVVVIQIHYLMTVALSKNKRNWFAQAFDIVYVDIKKEKMFESDIQDPNEIHDQTLLKGVNEDMLDDEEFDGEETEDEEFDESDEEMEGDESEEDLENEELEDDSDEEIDSDEDLEDSESDEELDEDSTEETSDEDLENDDENSENDDEIEEADESEETEDEENLEDDEEDFEENEETSEEEVKE